MVKHSLLSSDLEVLWVSADINQSSRVKVFFIRVRYLCCRHGVVPLILQCFLFMQQTSCPLLLLTYKSVFHRVWGIVWTGRSPTWWGTLRKTVFVYAVVLSRSCRASTTFTLTAKSSTQTSNQKTSCCVWRASTSSGQQRAAAPPPPPPPYWLAIRPNPQACTPTVILSYMIYERVLFLCVQSRCCWIHTKYSNSSRPLNILEWIYR